MCSNVVVIASIGSHDSAQMRLAQDNDVVHTFTPDRSDQPFGKAILPRRGWCGRSVPDGALGGTHYAGTLSAVSGKKTCMYVAIKEAVGETLTDDRNGNLVGNAGSTGTINYATGAYD